mmetsp:Transcript_5576/g.22004  ORF Transcript_5576/g.22004 Transcript_5576/m.22004 type:complete len:203 (-) Transcript_5576:25-633(-)
MRFFCRSSSRASLSLVKYFTLTSTSSGAQDTLFLFFFFAGGGAASASLPTTTSSARRFAAGAGASPDSFRVASGAAGAAVLSERNEDSERPARAGGLGAAGASALSGSFASGSPLSFTDGSCGGAFGPCDTDGTGGTLVGTGVGVGSFGATGALGASFAFGGAANIESMSVAVVDKSLGARVFSVAGTAAAGAAAFGGCATF